MMRTPAWVFLAAALAAATPTFARPTHSRADPADFSGAWTNYTVTPIERSGAFRGSTATDAEARAFETSSVRDFDNAEFDAVGGRQSEWFEYGGPMIRLDGQIRTSIVVDPRDGRLPYSAAGAARLDAAVKSRVSSFDNPENRPSGERCLMGGSGSSSVPMLPHWDNSHYQFVQTHGYLVIRVENGAAPRIIRTGLRQHLPASMRPLMGDSLGHWEGKTLVVETTNFNPVDAYKSPQRLYISPDARIVERFTRLSPTAIRYAFTVEDPAVYARPWTGELLFTADKGQIYEFACHEGNYSLPGIMAGARREEQLASK
jgi:hypothetical protein